MDRGADRRCRLPGRRGRGRAHGPGSHQGSDTSSAGADSRNREGGRGMGQEPGEIRQDIEGTRAEMCDTGQAIAEKADVPSRVKGRVAEKRDSVKERISGATSSISGATPDVEDVRDGGKRAVGIAQENPLGLAIGFLAGLTLPVTRVEEEQLAPVAVDVRERALETGQEALERGKQVAQDAAQGAAEAARESGHEQASGLKDTVQEQAAEVGSR